MKELVLDIGNDGSAQAMHFDEFDLGFLGKKKISRASEIMHNEETDLWDIYLPEKNMPECIWVMGFDGYDEARKFEVSWLQECRKAGVSPDSPNGRHIAKIVRKRSK